jgi:hypothetical protein
MTEKTETYRRMPATVLGTILRCFDRSTTWLAGDHVLLTKQVFLVEHYSRFYFADIQAISVCRTQTGKVWNILFATGTGLLALGGMINGFDSAILIWLAIFAIPLIINTLSGPTCLCCVYTAVNTHDLPCFNRLPKANLFLRTIKPLIAKVQGEVSDEQIVERAPLVSSVKRMQPGVSPPTRTHHYNGTVHQVLLWIVFVGAVTSAIQLTSPSKLFLWLANIQLLAQFGMAIAAAARQSGTDIPSGLRKVVWVAFGQVLIMAMMIMIISLMRIDQEFDTDYELISKTDTIQYATFLGAVLFSAALGFTGRYLLSRFRGNYRFKAMASEAPASASEASSHSFDGQEI